MEKLNNLTKLIDEKDALINELAEKIKVIEENQNRKEVTNKMMMKLKLIQLLPIPSLSLNVKIVTLSQKQMEVHVRAKHE